jgi:hypothetical protein
MASKGDEGLRDSDEEENIVNQNSQLKKTIKPLHSVTNPQPLIQPQEIHSDDL